MEEGQYAQHGEDRYLLRLFGQAHKGFFVEVGAFQPRYLSNSYLLEQAGWRGILVEPQPGLAAQLRQQRPGSTVVECAAGPPDAPPQAWLVVPEGLPSEATLQFEEPAPGSGEVHPVPVRTLNAILQDSGTRSVDVLSIDVEGNEVAVLKGLDAQRWQPSVILIEDHCADYSRKRCLRAMGYVQVARVGSNDVYVPRARAADFPADLRTSRFELFRKWYLSMPFRKLRRTLKGER